MMAAQSNNVSLRLIRATEALGSILKVAQLLDVDPRQVYRWIAELEQPTPNQTREMEKRLRKARITQLR